MEFVTCYILAKNEELNIAKCLRSLGQCEIPAVVLDSGSTDATKEIASRFGFCEIRDFAFTSHTDAWNLITGAWHNKDEYVMVLDADMEVSRDLWNEIRHAFSRRPEVIIAPVQMYVEGQPLRFGSMYPPKPIVFRGGFEYFVASGHCSHLKSHLKTYRTRAKLIHNDLKPYSAYLLSQVRYGGLLHERYNAGCVTLKDRLRATSPVMALVYPLVSLLVFGGIFSGRRGLIYALDRTIAVLIQYRVILAERSKKKE